jgi:hypothetical protein
MRSKLLYPVVALGCTAAFAAAGFERAERARAK